MIKINEFKNPILHEFIGMYVTYFHQSMGVGDPTRVKISAVIIAVHSIIMRTYYSTNYEEINERLDKFTVINEDGCLREIQSYAARLI